MHAKVVNFSIKYKLNFYTFGYLIASDMNDHVTISHVWDTD